MEKMRYEVDPFNRLTVKKTGGKSGIPVPRQVLDGTFKVGKDNALTYHIKTPCAGGTGIPRQVKLSGTWSLDKNHDLLITLDTLRRQSSGDRLTIRGEIIDAQENALVFEAGTRTQDGAYSAYILRLEGRWQADRNNRLTFGVRKERGTPDILTFDGIWDIAQKYQIIYRYRKEDRVRGEKMIQTLTFSGYWDIRRKARISYVIGKTAGSFFDFRAHAGVFRGKYIQYEVGIGVSHLSRPVRRVITLTGDWRLRQGAGLEFEVRYENRKIASIALGAQVRLTGQDTVSFRLRNGRNEDIGAELELSRVVFRGSGRAFLRLLASQGESAVCIGSGARW